MKAKIFTCVLLFSATALFLSCAGQITQGCRPVLFPYPEYSYKAVPQNLAGLYANKGELEQVDLFGIKLNLPNGCRYEKASPNAVKFSLIDGRRFGLFFKKQKGFTDNPKNIQFVGCDHFVVKSPTANITDKDYYTDLYLFTKDQISADPNFWQYFILWEKSKHLRHATKLIHYKGKRIEAFQMNVTSVCGVPDVDKKSQLVIFPDKITPNYLTIISNFTDDDFFADFLDMLDSLNP